MHKALVIMVVGIQ